MSGLYVLLLLALWLGLGYGGYRLWRRFAPQWAERKRLYVALGIAAGAVWLLWPFWEVAGEKMYYDAQVNRLCAVDGGVKVYETVKLPAEKFDKYGVVRIPSKQDAKPSDEYYYQSDSTYYRTGNPDMRRSHDRIIRRGDGKVLGEFIYYARRGGDMPGPWHNSSFGCPDISTQPSLENSIFVKEHRK